VIVFHQILNKVGVQTAGIVGVVFVDNKGIAVIAIQAVSGCKPHETAVVLQNGNHIALREPIVGGEVRKF
jgi:hypothetical protein